MFMGEWSRRLPKQKYDHYKVVHICNGISYKSTTSFLFEYGQSYVADYTMSSNTLRRFADSSRFHVSTIS